MNIKTIDINAREWFDKVNGNSYFSAVITLNFGMLDAMEIKLPFQYGYGDHYIDCAGSELAKLRYIPKDCARLTYSYCNDNGIILRTSKREGCLKRDVVAYGLN